MLMDCQKDGWMIISVCYGINSQIAFFFLLFFFCKTQWGDVAQNALVHHFISCVFCGSEIVSVHTVIESQNSLGWKGI